ncbi:hypothetical protein ASA1KI_43660 [Opitutales bacterium ASA1]|uniref:lamin tail domain-containing protein n=1 Tax=Congregicoccus parvus TaxID=3081749 RepID=UPI002B2B3BE2|nr:hypothetical protein ASA1KI_43660 [Opitutales bacterium ASA1]
MYPHPRYIAWVALAAVALPTSHAAPVLNEIMFRSGTAYPEDNTLEFVEIHNPDAESVDLSGWALTDGVSCVFPSGTILVAGGFLVVAADPTALATSGGFSGAVGPWTGRLANDGERITLSRPDDSGAWITVDTVRYADEGDWATRTRDSLGGWSWSSPAASSGKSLERRNPRLAVDNGQNWGPSSSVGGSPGVANSLFVGDIAPVITEVLHAPAVPTSSDNVVISCTLVDESAAPALNAVLWWRDASSTSPGSFTATAMTGESSGRFSATLPARAARQIVEFYVEATDGTNSRTWPAPSTEGQNTNCTFQVDDEVYTGPAPVYRLVLTAAENQAFASVNPRSDRQFNVTLVASRGADTTIRYLSSMRIRGNSSRQYSIKPLRIGIPSDNRWDGVKTFLIGTRAAPLQYLAHAAQRAAGLVAADVTPIEVRRQGIEYSVASGSTADYGKLVRVENFNGDYVDNHFPEAVDAQVYRKVSITNWSAAGTNPPSHPDSTWSGWSKENNSGANDWSDVIAFSSTWQQLAAPHFTGASSGNVASGTWRGTAFTDTELATLSTIVDLDYLARWLAVQIIMPNYEPNLSTGEDDDYAGAFVSDGTHTRFYPLPHDMDTTFGSGEQTFAYDAVPLYDTTEAGSTGMGGGAVMKPLQPLLGNSTTAGNAAFRAKYLTAVRELFGSVFDADTSTNATPAFHRFVDNHLGDWVSTSARNAIKTFMTNRQSYLLGVIGSAKITPVDGTSTATKNADTTPALRLNEILVSNTSVHAHGTAFPDVIELHNAGSTAVDLSGKRLGDADDPTAYTFPDGTTIAAGGYMLVYADSDTSGAGLHTGFALDAEGDEVFLHDSTAAGGALLDSLKFGFQIADLSLARTSSDASVWALASPTLGAANNEALSTGDVDDVVVNEWAGSIHLRTDKDFIELYNPSTSPVALGGARITDDILSRPARYDFRKLSFIPARGFLVLDTDKLEFGLDGDFDHVFFVGENGALIDQVDFVSQPEDHSTGRTTDGAATWTTFAVPTPGLPNDTSLPHGYTSLLNDLRISEVMFKPVAPSSAGDYEFVELRNIGSTTLDLSGVRFTNGIDYVFASGTTLAPGAQLVVCKKRSTFLARYPDAEVALASGNFSGSLDNSGETLALTLPEPWDVHILRFRYESDWYPLSSDSGYSLVVRSPGSTAARDWSESWAWNASSAVGGDPAGFPMTASSIEITSATTAAATVGEPFVYALTADEPPTSYTALGLPAGLSFDAASGTIAGTPTTAGSYAIDLSVSTAESTGAATLTLTVAAAVIAAQSGDVAATAGATTSLSVDVNGASSVGFQWQQLVAGVWADVPGATSSTLTLPSTQTFHSGAYRVLVVANGVASTVSVATIEVAAAAASDARLLNLSTRALALTGDDVLIPGFVVSGTGTKRLLVRAAGPALFAFGIEDFLVDPAMTIKRLDPVTGSWSDIATNDDWTDGPDPLSVDEAAASLGAFELAVDSRDAALLLDLVPGQYTVVAAGKAESTGVAIVELYEADESAPTARLANISNRGWVGTGGHVMIPGFVVSDEGARTFLIRAVGPTLADYGLEAVLENPILTVFHGSTAILSNDDWQENPSAATTAAAAELVGAFPLADGSRDAALVVTLEPGGYTVQASGADGGTGTALVEIYLVP